MTGDKRNTGRTTRMLHRALALADQGRAVYVIAANEMERQRLARQLADMAGEEGLMAWQYEVDGIKVETWNSLGHGFRVEDLWVPGMHPNCVVLVDHYAIESKFGKLLEEYHRYDEEV